MELRLLETAAALAALAALAACEKPEDRAALASAPPQFDLRYCADGDQAPTFHMPPGGCLTSNNRAYVLDMTQDGVLRLRAVRDGRPAGMVWTSGAKAKTADVSSLTFQVDGNLVVYNDGAAVWNSGPLGPGDYRLSLSDQGELLLRDQGGAVLWSSKTGHNARA